VFLKRWLSISRTASLLHPYFAASPKIPRTLKVQEGPKSDSHTDHESHEPYNFQRSSKTQCADKRTIPDGILAEVRVFRRTISMITYTPLIQTEASL